MTVRNLECALSPRSVALVGASPEPGSVGETIVNNLLTGGFAGPIWLVNPRHDRIGGQECFATVTALPQTPDLAVIATPPATVPGLIDELGRKGTRAAVVITAGIHNELRRAMLEATLPYCLRVIGPNCLGLWVPHLGLNASFGQLMPKPGKLAFLSQSGALVGGVLDWATARGIGFSYVVSMGDMADVDVGDLLDFLAADISTNAILMYLETIPAARKFMSAARSAARAKPVVVIKSGRFAESAKAAATHTGALAGGDNAVAAAFRRAGLVRVRELEELFTAAETLTWLRPIEGDRLTIVTNGGGAGVLAVDQLMQMGGQLPQPSAVLLAKLDGILPETWSRANPIDIVGDAQPARYGATLDAVLEDADTDAILVMNCPTALASSTEAASVVIETVERHRGRERSIPILTNWLGTDAVAEARRLFHAAGVPSYESPADAVRGFRYLWEYTQGQTALMRMPPREADLSDIDVDAGLAPIETAAKRGRVMLTEPEAKAVLAAYGIPTVPTRVAATVAEVEREAEALLRQHDALALKILSEDISHKSDVGGVRLDLTSVEEARQAAEDVQTRIAGLKPDARIQGFTVQPMIVRPRAHELILGVSEDPLFGPLILFGAGGTAAEVVQDTAVGLPPLDAKLARDLVEQTRIFKLLRGYRDRPAADLAAITDALVRLSQLVVDRPEIMELDINPLLADEKGVMALDARIRIDPAQVPASGANPRLAIRPYPNQWETWTTDRAGNTILLRPIRPADERLYEDFLAKLSAEDIRFRFLAPRTEFSHHFVARFTQIDYARAMAFVALSPDQSMLLGVARLSADADYRTAEYAVVVRSDLKGQGVGWRLMQQLIRYATSEGLDELYGDVLEANTSMLQMCRELGFAVALSDDPGLMKVRLKLRGARGAGRRSTPPA